MRKLIILILGICIAIALSSCNHHNQYGYPKKVTLPKEGCEMILTGETFIPQIEIYNSKGHRASAYTLDVNTDSTYYSATLDWLTVEHFPHTNSITLKAAPNKTGKIRKLRIDGYVGPCDLEIYVKQGR